ncbi:MAG TPA: MFS transporter [Bryobacteraceae bacterium]|nr:MFS transporter [Bryobacteraceae bacterium]
MATPEALSPPPTLQEAKRGRVLIAACFCVFVSFASIVVYTFGVFLKPVAEAFHWSRAQVSFAFTVAALTIAACSPLLGRLLDRFPARRVVLPCTIVYGIAFGSLAFLTAHLWHFYAVFVVLGIVGNATTQLGYARTISAIFDKQRGRALAALMAGTGFGSMIFPPFAEFLISAYGWRMAYAVLGSIILALGVPPIILFLQEPESSGVFAEPALKEKAGKSIFAPAFLGIAAALLLFSFATNGLNAHWAALLSDHGATVSQIATVLFAAGLATLFAKLSTGYLLDRLHAGRVAALLLTACAIGFVIILLKYQLRLAILSALLVGIGMGAESDAVPYLLTRYFGLTRFGELYGYTWCVYAVAGATGPVAMGAVFDHTGSYQAVLLLSLGLVIAAALIFTLLPSYRLEAYS